MTTSASTSKAAATARHLADSALQSAEEAVESTRVFTNDSLERAGDKVRGIRCEVDPAIDRLAARAEHLVERGLGYYADAASRARRQLNGYSDATGRYVAARPLKSALIAAAAGAALTAVVMMAARRRD
ncbi:hypothetical protein PY257_06360 [Ramlibacter sp. H39-3-26]|uniref:hypothetical protein n=1 Tax=Curvibacter soli TaxID=3031331 RepID=UPI0023DAC0C7|nr:hypothetical protein [Ramlibacter sp. H39-3-26]MDF1484812.1 hypothetical protein [Ramlibacter sp. H39-3-26]